MNRRDFLRMSAGAAALTATHGALGRSALAANAKPKRPRYFVYFFLMGGIDSLYSFDPRVAGSVDDRIWIPYGPKDIVEANGIRLAPYASSLAPYTDRMAVLNGVETSTLAHEMGEVQAHFMSRDSLDVIQPSFTCEIGASLRPDSPLHEVRIGRSGFLTLRRRPGGRTLCIDPAAIDKFRELDKANPGHYDTALEDLEKRYKSAPDERTRESIGVTLHLMHGIRKYPQVRRMTSDFATSLDAKLLAELPPREKMKLEYSAVNFRETFDQIAWLLQNDLTPTVWTDVPIMLDSHVLNHGLQVNGISIVTRTIAEFLNHIRPLTSVTGTPLIDEVAVLATSELGRFPLLNNFGKGKDHLPLAPMMLYGNGVRPGVYGETDRLMIARPVSMSTGKPGPNATNMTIDDVGASVRAWFGEAQPPWLRGRPLEFLFS